MKDSSYTIRKWRHDAKKLKQSFYKQIIIFMFMQSLYSFLLNNENILLFTLKHHSLNIKTKFNLSDFACKNWYLEIFHEKQKYMY